MASDWREFEREVAEVFGMHGYETTVHHVFHHGRKYEIDVVAKKGNTCFCVDCKYYGAHWHRKAALRRHARAHTERCRAFEEHTGMVTIPLIITAIDDGLLISDDCLFIPYHTLNDFLMHADEYLTVFFRGHLTRADG